MKGFSAAVALLSLAATEVSAHYIFLKLAAGGQKFQQYEHIRYNTNYNSPVTGMPTSFGGFPGLLSSRLTFLAPQQQSWDPMT